MTHNVTYTIGDKQHYSSIFPESKIIILFKLLLPFINLKRLRVFNIDILRFNKTFEVLIMNFTICTFGVSTTNDTPSEKGPTRNKIIVKPLLL